LFNIQRLYKAHFICVQMYRL